MPLGVAQQDYFALALEALDQALAAEPSALEVVGRDEADVAVALQPRVEDDDGDLPGDRVVDGLDQRRLVERGDHDARDAAADEALDLGHLRVAIVLAQRPAPDDRGAVFLAGALGAGADALPELVRRALRNHRDGERAGPRRRGPR